MNKKFIIIFFVLLLLGSVGIYVVNHQDTSNIVVIKSHGKELYRFDITKEKDHNIEIKNNNEINIIEIKNHKIRVIEANCDNQICVDTGYLKKGTPIICLPHELSIEYISDDIDAGI